MADVAATQVPTYLARKGSVIDLPQRVVEARRITVVEACKLIKAQLGAAYTPKVFADVSAAWPDGVPEDQISALCAQLLPADRSVESGLRAIGGGAA